MARVYIDRALIIILVISIVLSSFIESVIIRAYLSLVSFLALPYLSGKIVFIKNKRLDIDRLSCAAKFVLSWSSGLFIMLLISVLLSYVNYFDIRIVYTIMLLLSIFMVFHSRYVIQFNKESLKKNSFVIFLVFIALFKVSIIKSLSPYPLQIAADIFSHMLIISKINEGFFSIFLTDYSNAFFINAYTPIFHLLLSLITKLHNITVIDFTWVYPFFSYIFYPIGVYLLSYKLTNIRYIGFLSGILSILFMEYGLVTSIFTLIPSTLLMLLAPFYLFVFIEVNDDIKNIDKNIAFGLLFLISSISFFIHFMMGLLIIAIFVSYLFMKNIFEINKLWLLSNRLIFIIIFFSVVLIYVGLWNLDNLVIDLFQKESNTNYILNYDFKYNLLGDWFSNEIFFFSIIGIIISTLFFSMKLIRFSLIHMALIILYFMAISFSMRVYFLLHITVAIFASVLFYDITKIKRINILVVMILCIVIVIFPLFTTINYITVSQSKNTQLSTFTMAEYELGRVLQCPSGEKCMLVSEPQTQNIMSGLSGIESLNTFFTPQDTQAKIKDAFNDNDVISMHTKFLSLTNNSHTIVIINGRVESWITNEDYTPRFYPYPLNDISRFHNFFNSSYFKPLFNKSNEIYAFEVNYPVSYT